MDYILFSRGEQRARIDVGVQRTRGGFANYDSGVAAGRPRPARNDDTRRVRASLPSSLPRMRARVPQSGQRSALPPAQTVRPLETSHRGIRPSEVYGGPAFYGSFKR